MSLLTLWVCCSYRSVFSTCGYDSTSVWILYCVSLVHGNECTPGNCLYQVITRCAGMCPYQGTKTVIKIFLCRKFESSWYGDRNIEPIIKQFQFFVKRLEKLNIRPTSLNGFKICTHLLIWNSKKEDTPLSKK